MAFLRSIQIFMNGLFMENYTDVLRPPPPAFSLSSLVADNPSIQLDTQRFPRLCLESAAQANRIFFQCTAQDSPIVREPPVGGGPTNVVGETLTRRSKK
jgi:hypothetical protein